MNRLVLVSLLSLAVTSSASAQQLQLDIQDGRVTLDATAVPARLILARWAEVGGTKVVGADKVPGGPLTLKLVNMPERQALDIILRSAAGFMAAPRLASATPGASMYDRILILATSTPPAGAAASAANRGAANAQGAQNGSQNNGVVRSPPQFRMPPRPPGMQPSPADNDADADEVVEVDDQPNNGNEQRVFTFPAPPGSQTGEPVFVPMPNQNGNTGIFRPVQAGGAAAPVITLQPNGNGQSTIYNFVPNADGGAPTQPAPQPFRGFGSPQPGTVGSPQPGMIAPVPQPQPAPPQPNQQRPPPPL